MIEVKNICKKYKVFKREAGFKNSLLSIFHRKYSLVNAVDNISFSINKGEIVGYIGPNGAGKSSTIKILSGILVPDSGTCVIDGKIPWKNRIEHVKNIGVVFGQKSQLWWDVPVIDSFELLKDIYKIPSAEYKINLEKLIFSLSLKELLHTPTRQLSLGQRMKCEIAASLLHNPKILFLDEPTIGLDAVSKLSIRDFILKLNSEEKVTVVLTTHDMQDVEALTKRVILIGKGRVLLDSDISKIKKNGETLEKAVVNLYKNYKI